LEASHDLTYPDLIPPVNCPPVGRGGPSRIYCPICGQRFISSGQGNKIWFQHLGTELGSYRMLYEGWPEQLSGERWCDVRDPKSGWTWDAIHDALGYSNSGRGFSHAMNEERRIRNEDLRKEMIPIRFHNNGIGWDAWAVSPHKEDETPVFSIEGSPQVVSCDGETWYKIQNLNEASNVVFDGVSETINWPIGSSNAAIIVQEGHDMGSGTLSHPRHRASDLESGNFFNVTDDGGIEIANVRFAQAQRSDKTNFEIALPNIKGTIPWLKDEHVVPIHISGDAKSELTLIRPIIHDSEPWHILGEVNLNTEHFRGVNQDLRPAIELQQIDGGNVSHRTVITLYPSFSVPEPNPSYISIDGEQSTPGIVCYVEKIPNEINFTTSNGKEYSLHERKMIMFYCYKEGGNEKWHRSDGILSEALEILEGLSSNLVSFSISIICNSRNDLWDWIQISKIPPAPLQIDVSKSLDALTELDIDRKKIKLTRKLKRRLRQKSSWRPIDVVIHSLTQEEYEQISSRYKFE
jgi:hypothetical protein